MLDYADFITDSCVKSKVKNLDKIQKRAIHVIDNKSNHGLNYEQLLNVYNQGRRKGGGSRGSDDPPFLGANFIHFLCKMLMMRSVQKTPLKT